MSTITASKCRVLIVEDDITNREIIFDCLKDDYEVFIADSVKSAMAIMDYQPIDIGLFDIGLPDGSGLDLCRMVKSDHDKYGGLSIIFITAMDKPADEVRGLQLGGSDYISKPINTAVLSARVELQVTLKRKSLLLEELARIDGLTEIPNRRAFDDHLEKSWSHARRINVPLSLAILDIDYFKQFNDVYGHPAGDSCLKRLAKCLQEKIKQGSDHIARFGGEEFVVVLFDCDNQQATQIIEMLLSSFRVLNIPHSGSEVADVATFSAGVCSVIPKTQEQESFLMAADKLLYEAKKRGRNQVVAGEFNSAKT